MTKETLDTILGQNLEILDKAFSDTYNKHQYALLFYEVLREDEYYARSIAADILGYSPKTISVLRYTEELDKELYLNFIKKYASKVIPAEKKEECFISHFEQDFDNNNSYAYILKMKTDFGTLVKVGKSNNPNQRISQIFKDKRIFAIEPLKFYEFETEEDAFEMEIILHRYFKKEYPNTFIPQDRFLIDKVSKEDYDNLEKKYKFLLDNIENL